MESRADFTYVTNVGAAKVGRTARNMWEVQFGKHAVDEFRPRFVPRHIIKFVTVLGDFVRRARC